ncbi:MAG: hypothetical protein M8364_12890 [Methylobacter sp.]|uniref:hypothetical protein n=1 Tax=Methylobacter sp. TaxID=2051955 RepID=UPI002589ABEF|nr:hypothetical protein [Methylobacter sp.]MCL7421792.1 hypothetical protein [Methylobacter sp.]
MDQIFNELSASECYESKFSASEGMERLLLLSKEMRNVGFSSHLRTTRDFSQLKIAPEYTILDWVRDKSICANPDLQRQLLISATKSPYIEDFLEKEQTNQIVEFKYETTQVHGLGLAYLWGTAALSLDGDRRFANDNITLQFYKVDDESEVLESIKAITISSKVHLDKNRELLKNSFFKDITSGNALLNHLSSLFPRLSIAKNATKQLKSLTGCEQYFQEIVHHFRILNETMAQWKSGSFEPESISWSPESQSTLDQFGAQRQFVCADEVKRLFSLHSKILSANKRIYYFPIIDQQVVHIGYVGGHLPTTKYRT